MGFTVYIYSILHVHMYVPVFDTTSDASCCTGRSESVNFFPSLSSDKELPDGEDQLKLLRECGGCGLGGLSGCVPYTMVTSTCITTLYSN